MWRAREHGVECGVRTLVMGVINVTPDSFSDGGRFLDAEVAVRAGIEMAADGADLLDVGGESTRPGSDAVSAEQEIDRVIPVIKRLVAEVTGMPVSVDTRKPEVARAAMDVGASIVNDVTAGSAPGMFEVVRDAGAGMVLMHMLGDPKTMQDDPRYDDVVAEVGDFLRDRVDAAVAAGIERDHLAIDPGLGFGKTMDHNLVLMRDVGAFRALGVPVVVGPSRKSFIGALSGVDEPSRRVEGTAGAVAWLAANGAHVVRVHDVVAMKRVLQVVDAVREGTGP